MKKMSIICSKNSRIRSSDRVAIIDGILFDNRPSLSFGIRYVENATQHPRQSYLYPSVREFFEKTQTRKQSILPLLVDCSQERPVRQEKSASYRVKTFSPHENLLCKSLIVGQAVSDTDTTYSTSRTQMNECVPHRY